MKPPIRKSIRLKEYDYTQNGAYFITICTSNREPWLSKIVGGGFQSLPLGYAAPQIELTPIGLEVERTIEYVSFHNENVIIEKFVIMPNHIHMMVFLNSGMFLGGHGNPPLLNSGKLSDENGNPSLHTVIGQLKSYTTKQFNMINNTKYQTLWQRSYHDHIIRDEQDYEQIWQYIDENPLKWAQDCYYTGS